MTSERATPFIVVLLSRRTMKAYEGFDALFVLQDKQQVDNGLRGCRCFAHKRSNAMTDFRWISNQEERAMPQSAASPKTKRKERANRTEPTGPVLQFQWSNTRFHIPVMDDRVSLVLPPIATGRSQQTSLASARSSIGKQETFSIILLFSPLDRYSLRKSSASTQSTLISLPRTRRRQSPGSIDEDKDSESTTRSPLSLTCAQLHQVPELPFVDRRQRAHYTLSPVCIVRTTANGMTSAVFQPVLPKVKANRAKRVKPLQRLGSAELRQLNVSEKYIKEAKKLYYHTNWRSFVPYLPALAVS